MTINIDFTALTAYPLFYRTYSRYKADGTKESPQEAKERSIKGLENFGLLTEEELELIRKYFYANQVFVSGRWFWVGGTEWVEKQKNYIGAYNCASVPVVNWDAFRFNFRALLMGCGVGTVVELDKIEQLPKIKYPINLVEVTELGTNWVEGNSENDDSYFTAYKIDEDTLGIIYTVGDSKEGWVDIATDLLEFSSISLVGNEGRTVDFDYKQVNLSIDLSYVRPAGIPLKGFGGLSNPEKLEEGLKAITEILNETVGRKLNSLQVCKVLAWAGVISVSGNIRRCLPESSLVHTSKGLVPIKDIEVGSLVQTPLGFRKVTAKFDQGLQDVYELETNSFTPRATLNHRYAVLSSAKGDVSWKRVEELVEGDRLMHNTQLLPGGVTHLPEDFTAERPINSRTAKDFVVPELNSNIAWLIGYTHGNGYVSLGRHKTNNKPYGFVSWSTNSTYTELAPKLQEKIDIALALFGLSARHSNLKNENTAKSICSCIRLAEYFSEFIKKPKEPLIIPSFILQGSVDIRAAYLAGLVDSDGAVNNRPPHLVTTVYRLFAKQVAAVVSSLGIAGRYATTYPKEENWQVKYSITIPAFKQNYNSIIAPYSAKGELKIGQKRCGFTVPKYLVQQVYVWQELRNMGFQTSQTADCNYERYIVETDLSLDIPVTFKGLGSLDNVQTYDIEVEEAHCFYCDGFLTHNSAKINQGSPDDELFVTSKDNLWVQDAEGNWKIDPKRDMLRLANHTISYHYKPNLETVVNAVSKQYYSGEGAIQYTPEFIARGNADLLDTKDKKLAFIALYCNSKDLAKKYLVHLATDRYYDMDDRELEHRINRYGANPCHEVGGASFLCNLSQVHLNMLDPHNTKQQEEAFRASTLCALPLLSHIFDIEDFRYSREIDPIIGISFTGLFDFFVHKFGYDWLEWWKTARSKNYPKAQYYLDSERLCLELWRDSVRNTTEEYCKKHSIKPPNRYTVVQPSGSVSLLTNASPGWHPPKATRYIRRITYSADSPIVQACRDLGYNVVPSQSCKDEHGNLLNDINDPRVNEVLVEIPVEVSWASIADEANFNPKDIEVLAQLDFYMQVQKFYATHTVSATLELSEHEIEPLGRAIYELIQNDEGYISTALLAKFESLETFPRLPFEPISHEKYLAELEGVKQRRISDDFLALVNQYSTGESSASESGPAGCDSDKCLMPERK